MDSYFLPHFLQTGFSLTKQSWPRFIDLTRACFFFSEHNKTMTEKVATLLLLLCKKNCPSFLVHETLVPHKGINTNLAKSRSYFWLMFVFSSTTGRYLWGFLALSEPCSAKHGGSTRFSPTRKYKEW